MSRTIGVHKLSIQTIGHVGVVRQLFTPSLQHGRSQLLRWSASATSHPHFNATLQQQNLASARPRFSSTSSSASAARDAADNFAASKTKSLLSRSIVRDCTSQEFSLPPLPYGMNDLSPYLSEEALKYHHGGHLKAYVNKLNELTADDTQLQSMSLADILATRSGLLFNQAAQLFNHWFYFNCLRPFNGVANEPPEILKKLIAEAYGSFEKFKEEFENESMKHFGSGWSWLVLVPHGGHDGMPSFRIVSTHDAMTPQRSGDGHPLLTCDLWEHAYYIDYRNARLKYLKGWWQIVNWDVVLANFQDAVLRSWKDR
eukprot:Lankesteria_metandrocarpae@DN3557_c0_g1_i1.p1